MRPGRLTFDSTHRKYSVESASAWMPSSPCHLSVYVFVYFGDRAVCHRERRGGGGGGPPSSFLHTTESASRANCSSPLPKNIKTDLYIYTALYTLFFFYHCKSQKYRKIKCFIITGHFSFSLCLFLPGKKVVPGGNWLTPSVKFVAVLTPLPRRHFLRLPSSLASLSRGTPSRLLLVLFS